LACKINSEEDNRVCPLAALPANQLAGHISSIFQDLVLNILRQPSNTGPKHHGVRAFVCTTKVNMRSGGARRADLMQGDRTRKTIIST
jgi:hypothetical protein